MDGEFFVVRMSSALVEVYSAETFRLKRYIAVSGLVAATHIASCAHSRCLYIADCSQKLVHRVDVVASNVTVATRWQVGEKPHGLSVTPLERQVLVSCSDANRLRRFTSNGQIVGDVLLCAEIIEVRHAVQLVTGQLVVCHGRLPRTSPQVCYNIITSSTPTFVSKR